MTFDDDYTPHQLKPTQFKEFVFFFLKDFYVDLSQPFRWTRVCRADGEGVSRSRLARELAPKLAEFGAVLTPNLLSKIIQLFLIHGPLIADDLSYRGRSEARATLENTEGRA